MRIAFMSRQRSRVDTQASALKTTARYLPHRSYELNCPRYADYSCQGPTGNSRASDTWIVRHPGAWQGDCKMVRGQEICEAPSERWLHGAAMFNDSTMLIYGGFSQVGWGLTLSCTFAANSSLPSTSHSGVKTTAMTCGLST